jgi:hypothetical protein
MKKFYILAAFVAFAFNANAQVDFTEDFDGFALGDISAQSPDFRTWSGPDGSAEDADVVNTQSASGTQAMNVVAGNDQIFLVPGAPTTGTYMVQWKMLVFTGTKGYFNMQAAFTAEPSPWAQALMGGNVYFNCDGSGDGTTATGIVSGATDCTGATQTFTYPEGTWFTITNIYDLDAQTWGMDIDGVMQFTGEPLAFGSQVFESLAGFDFFSVDSSYFYFVDDLKTGPDLFLATEDFSKDNFSVYPNPVQDVLNIKSAQVVDAVTVYDLLGKVVLQAQPGTVSPALDMSALNNGAYLVKVTIGNASKTVKVLK